MIYSWRTALQQDWKQCQHVESHKQRRQRRLGKRWLQSNNSNRSCLCRPTWYWLSISHRCPCCCLLIPSARSVRSWGGLLCFHGCASQLFGAGLEPHGWWKLWAGLMIWMCLLLEVVTVFVSAWFNDWQRLISFWYSLFQNKFTSHYLIWPLNPLPSQADHFLPPSPFTDFPNSGLRSSVTLALNSVHQALASPPHALHS